MNKVIKALVLLIQIGFIIGTYILEGLSKKKMGVLRYLDFKNIKLEEFWFSDIATLIYGALFATIAILSLYLLFKIIKDKALVLKLECGLGIIMGGLGVYLSLWSSVEDYKARYFLIMGVGIASLIQIIKLKLIAKKEMPYSL